MIDLRPIYTSASASSLLTLGIVLITAGAILFMITVYGIIVMSEEPRIKHKHPVWLYHVDRWIVDNGNIFGLLFAAWAMFLCIGIGVMYVIPNSALHRSATTPRPPSTQTIVRYVESKTDATHLSCDDKTDTNDIIPCTFVLDNTPRDGKLVIDNDHATLFYNDNATFVPVTVKTTN